MIIVGVDFGVTGALAILDENGKLLFLKSQKEYTKSKMIEDILKFGKPIAICYDKPFVSQKLKKLCSSFGVNPIVPKREYSNKHKEKIVKKYFKGIIKNKHERDALFSAIIGFKQLRRKIEKMKNAII